MLQLAGPSVLYSRRHLLEPPGRSCFLVSTTVRICEDSQMSPLESRPCWFVFRSNVLEAARTAADLSRSLAQFLRSQLQEVEINATQQANVTLAHSRNDIPELEQA